MGPTTICSLARELGLKYGQVRHVLRRGYVPVELPARRKCYLNAGQVRAIKAYFGFTAEDQSSVADPKTAPEDGETSAVPRVTGLADRAARRPSRAVPNTTTGPTRPGGRRDHGE